MKLLFRVIIREKEKLEYKELIAATPADAGINAIQNFTGVIEVINVPWNEMTEEQKIKVVEADSAAHDRKLRTQKLENSINEGFDRIDRLCNEFRKEISQFKNNKYALA